MRCEMQEKMFNDLLESIDEAKQVLQERQKLKLQTANYIKNLRHKFGLSQAQFAKKYGFAVGTLKNWEQAIRLPDKTSTLLLKLIDKYPEIVEETANIA